MYNNRTIFSLKHKMLKSMMQKKGKKRYIFRCCAKGKTKASTCASRVRRFSGKLFQYCSVRFSVSPTKRRQKLCDPLHYLFFCFVIQIRSQLRSLSHYYWHQHIVNNEYPFCIHGDVEFQNQTIDDDCYHGSSAFD